MYQSGFATPSWQIWKFIKSERKMRQCGRVTISRIWRYFFWIFSAFKSFPGNISFGISMIFLWQYFFWYFNDISLTMFLLVSLSPAWPLCPLPDACPQVSNKKTCPQVSILPHICIQLTCLQVSNFSKLFQPAPKFKTIKAIKLSPSKLHLFCSIFLWCQTFCGVWTLCHLPHLNLNIPIQCIMSSTSQHLNLNNIEHFQIHSLKACGWGGARLVLDNEKRILAFTIHMNTTIPCLV